MRASRFAPQHSAGRDRCLRIRLDEKPTDNPFAPGDKVTGSVVLQQNDINNLIWKSDKSPGWNAGISSGTQLQLELVGRTYSKIKKRHDAGPINYPAESLTSSTRLFKTKANVPECEVEAGKSATWRFDVAISDPPPQESSLPPTFQCNGWSNFGDSWDCRVDYKIYVRVDIGDDTLAGQMAIQVCPFTTSVSPQRHRKKQNCEVQSMALLRNRAGKRAAFSERFRGAFNSSSVPRYGFRAISSIPNEVAIGQTLNGSLKLECGLTLKHRNQEKVAAPQIILESVSMEVCASTTAATAEYTLGGPETILSQSWTFEKVMRADNDGHPSFALDGFRIPMSTTPTFTAKYVSRQYNCIVRWVLKCADKRIEVKDRSALHVHGALKPKDEEKDPGEQKSPLSYLEAKEDESSDSMTTP